MDPAKLSTARGAAAAKRMNTTNPLPTPSLHAAVAAEQTHLHVPSQPEWIAPTIEYLKQKALLNGACPETRARKLTLALHEALTNSVVHGNLELSSDLKEQSGSAFAEAMAARAADPHYGHRPVEIRIDYDGERCRWTFTDQGKGFDAEGALARAAQNEPDVMLASGRGILLMRAFLDDVRYEAGGRRVVLTMARPSEGRRSKSLAPRLVSDPLGAMLEQYGSATLAPDDRRAHPRAAYTQHIRIETTPGCEPIIGFGRDLSRGGICFLSVVPLPLEDVTVALPQSEGAELRLRARIVRCNPIMAAVFDVGARFVESDDSSAI